MNYSTFQDYRSQKKTFYKRKIFKNDNNKQPYHPQNNRFPRRV